MERTFSAAALRLGCYRTAVSVWTQFHFGYTWLAHCESPLTASADDDKRGIDALVELPQGQKVALQIKKETYRKEAKGENRFLKKRNPSVNLFVEIPYTLVRPEDWERRVQKARKETSREGYVLWKSVAQNLRSLENGFVVFEPSYVKAVENFIKEKIGATPNPPHIPWNELARYLTHFQ